MVVAVVVQVMEEEVLVVQVEVVDTAQGQAVLQL